MPSQSAGDRTSYSTGRVLASESVSNAAERSSPNSVQRSQSGRKAAHAAISMNVAKASFNQIPFHQRIVTRSPNHMWASSWATTSATFWCSLCVLVAGSSSSRLSRNVMQPRFSIAPAAKSGRASRSTFVLGYGMP